MPPIVDIPRARRALLKAEANSLKHRLTHKSNNPFCEACCRGNMCAKKRMGGAFGRELKGWGSIVTGDHLVGSKGQMEGLTDDQDALTINNVFLILSTVTRLSLSQRKTPTMQCNISPREDWLACGTLTAQVSLRAQRQSYASPKTLRCLERPRTMR